MNPSQRPAEMRRYDLPTVDGLEGWATVVIGSDGYFSTVSDYGNYAFRWTAFGDRDFRRFLLNAEKDVDYFTKKLQPGGDGPGDIYDGEATERAIKRHILEYRREGVRSWTKERARQEWELLERCSGVWSKDDFSEWYRETTVEDAYEFACHRRNPQAQAFVERILVARLCPIFRAELEADAAQSNSVAEGGHDDGR